MQKGALGDGDLRRRVCRAGSHLELFLLRGYI